MMYVCNITGHMASRKLIRSEEDVKFSHCIWCKKRIVKVLHTVWTAYEYKPTPLDWTTG